MKKIVLLASLVFAGCTDNMWRDPPQDAGSKEQKVKEEVCNELETMLCAKASTCSLIDYNDCREKFDPLAKCESNEILALDLCRTEMRNMHCDQDLPDSCIKLQ